MHSQDNTVRPVGVFRRKSDFEHGIFGREAFFAKTYELIVSNPEKRYILLCLNILQFKIVNDLLGIEKGDEILCRLGKYLNQIITDGVCGNIQGDRYGICIEKNFFSEELARKFISDFQKQLDISYDLFFQIGVYDIQDVSVHVENMYDRAKLACESIRGDYLKTFAYYDDKLRQDLRTHQELTSEISKGIENGEFVIYLQPIYSITDDKPVFCEVLVRWNHPKRGMISPSIFIPMCEKNGFIARLDYYIFEQACKYLRDRLSKGCPAVPLSVNVSRVNIHNRRLVDEIVKIADSYGIDHSLVMAEITESVFTDNIQQVIITIHELQSNGFKVLMDDFGSGYSSLNALKDLPVDFLKIDMRFLKDLDTSAKAANILTSIIRMSKWMGLPVIAEGVETENQLKFLKSVGCDMVQGFFFCKPAPAEEFNCLKTLSSAQNLQAAPFKFDANDFDTVFNGNQVTNLLFASIIGGVGLYEYDGVNLEILRANESYFKIMGCDIKQFYSQSENMFDKIHPDDRDNFKLVCDELVKNKESAKTLFRRIKNDGGVIYLEAFLKFMSGVNTCLFCMAFNDVTDKVIGEAARKRSEEVAAIQAHKIKNQQDFLQNIFDTVPCGIVYYEIIDGIPKVTSYNNACITIFGCQTGEEFLEQLDKGFYHEMVKGDAQKYHRFLDSVYSVGGPMGLIGRILCKNGEIKWVKSLINKVLMPSGKYVLQSVFLDITQEKERERKLQDEINRNEIFKMLTDISKSIVFEYDTITDIMNLSVPLENGITKRVISDYIAYISESQVIREDFKDTYKKLIIAAKSKPVESSFEYVGNYIGEYRWYRVLYKNLSDETGKIIQIIGIVQDIQSEKSMEEKFAKEIDKQIKKQNKLLSMARKDAVTGLYNRMATEQMVGSAIKEDFKNGVGSALLVLDMDKFKHINDNYGHQFGDKIIAETGKIFRKHCRKGDLLGRIGGDEFVAYLRGVQTEAQAAQIIKRTSDEIGGLQQKYGIELAVSLSCGVAFVKSEIPYQEAFRRADNAMYEAKRKSKLYYIAKMN